MLAQDICQAPTRLLIGIGMLLFLIKHSCPDLAKVAEELSKANDSANPVAYMEVLHVIKYVIDMKDLVLKIESTGNFNEP